MNFFKWLFSKMKRKEEDIEKSNAAKEIVLIGVVTAAMVSPAVFLAKSVEVGAPMTEKFEGLVLENYLDSVGIETWCVGETQMGRLEEGYTIEYCRALFNTRFAQYSAQLYSCYTEDMKRYVTPSMHASFTDVYYNTGAKCRTGMMRNIKRGKPVAACNFTLKYKRAGGKDCSIRKNNCWGVWDRRVTMLPVCVSDAEQIPAGGLGAE